jgi:hypothetical protein
LILRPDSNISAVRWRPIRRATDTQPPAPGIKPMASSGSWNQAEDEAVTLPANAAISRPAPMQAPWM